MLTSQNDPGICCLVVGLYDYDHLELILHLVQMQMRRLPKPVIAMVAGYAVGGGHILHLVADLTVSCSFCELIKAFFVDACAAAKSCT